MKKITWQEALKEFEVIYLPSRNLARRTRIEYFNDVQVFIDFLEQACISQVGEMSLRHIDRFLAILEDRGMSGATRKRKAITIRAFLSFLYRSGYLAQDLSRQVILPFAENSIPRVLTQNEYYQMLQACTGNIRDMAIITLLLQTGIRLSELTRLTLQDLDLPETGSGEARIASFGSRKGRVIPLNSKACQAVKAYLQDRAGSPVTSIFLNNRGKPLGSRGVEKILGKYFQKAGVWGASTHSLRHTFGVQHLIKGTSLETVQKVMGHQDIRTTEEYMQLVQEVIKKELEENAL